MGGVSFALPRPIQAFAFANVVKYKWHHEQISSELLRHLDINCVG
jgi:hypothetical protein